MYPKTRGNFLVQAFTLVLVLLTLQITGADQTQPMKKRPSAVFVFGDSTVDSGNNNFIGTLFKSNFPPYGRDLADHIPTGRFTNGKLVTDYIAAYVGLKELVPPYLDPTLNLEELMTGVSFASAGTGFDPLTSQITSVISMSRQLDYFREYRGRTEESIGKKRTEALISNALFLISCGTNDFLLKLFQNPQQKPVSDLNSYHQFLLQQIQHFLQDLWAEGVMKIGLVGLPPLGCIPVVITRQSTNLLIPRNCVDSYSSISRDYNLLLENKLKDMQKSSGRTLIYLDIYTPLDNFIGLHDKFGFEVASRGCCGTGMIEASCLCNTNTPVCPDASEFVFWDSVHPTERTYYLIFKSIIPAIDAILGA